VEKPPSAGFHPERRLGSTEQRATLQTFMLETLQQLDLVRLVATTHEDEVLRANLPGRASRV
jgi:hypothetical protein